MVGKPIGKKRHLRQLLRRWRGWFSGSVGHGVQTNLGARARSARTQTPKPSVDLTIPPTFGPALPDVAGGPCAIFKSSPVTGFGLINKASPPLRGLRISRRSSDSVVEATMATLLSSRLSLFPESPRQTRPAPSLGGMSAYNGAGPSFLVIPESSMRHQSDGAAFFPEKCRESRFTVPLYEGSAKSSLTTPTASEAVNLGNSPPPKRLQPSSRRAVCRTVQTGEAIGCRGEPRAPPALNARLGMARGHPESSSKPGHRTIELVRCPLTLVILHTLDSACVFSFFLRKVSPPPAVGPLLQPVGTRIPTRVSFDQPAMEMKSFRRSQDSVLGRQATQHN